MTNFRINENSFVHVHAMCCVLYVVLLGIELSFLKEVPTHNRALKCASMLTMHNNNPYGIFQNNLSLKYSIKPYFVVIYSEILRFVGVFFITLILYFSSKH